MRRAASLLLFVAALAAQLGCGGDSEDRASERAAAEGAAPSAQRLSRPRLCGRLRGRRTGRVATAAAVELSGLAVSRTQPRTLWAHNDSGDGPRVFALDERARPLAEVRLLGATNVDWEAIAASPARGAGGALFVGDIGDNDEARPSVVVYRAREPRARGSAARLSARATALSMRYPDGPHDAEALLVDADGGSIVIVTKDFGGDGGVYAARRAVAGATTTLRRTGSVELGIGHPVTAGDVSADGRTIVLRSYERAFAWRRRRGESLARALRRRPCLVRPSLLHEGQGEAIALTRGGGAFFTVAEGRRPPLRRYEPAG